jgi:hypothetical protein
MRTRRLIQNDVLRQHLLWRYLIWQHVGVGRVMLLE